MTRSRSSRQHWTFLIFILFGFALATLHLFNSPNPNPTAINPSPVIAFPSPPANPTPNNTTDRPFPVATSPTTPNPLLMSPVAIAPTPTLSQPLPAQSISQPTRQPTVSIAPTIKPAQPIAPTIAPGVAATQPQSIAAPASLYGHLPYAEAAPSDLVSVGQYGDRAEFLHHEAAAAYGQMQQAAQSAGVHLVSISGFRDLAVQTDLFAAQTARRGSEAAAARISAPPGYSEHHTGYAIDMGDADRPETDLEITFEQTHAFAWLRQNASQFGFELSFPPGNVQGISYEPWHWRFVMSPQSSQVFAYAP